MRVCQRHLGVACAALTDEPFRMLELRHRLVEDEAEVAAECGGGAEALVHLLILAAGGIKACTEAVGVRVQRRRELARVKRLGDRKQLGSPGEVAERERRFDGSDHGCLDGGVRDPELVAVGKYSLDDSKGFHVASLGAQKVRVQEGVGGSSLRVGGIAEL